MSSTNVRESKQTDFLSYDRTMGLAAMEGRGLYFPADMTLGANGKIYVANRSNHPVPRGVRVTILDLEENFYKVFGSFGREPGQFIWATGLASDSKGAIYLSDIETNMISVFDAEGNYQSRWGTYGAGAHDGARDGVRSRTTSARGSRPCGYNHRGVAGRNRGNPDTGRPV